MAKGFLALATFLILSEAQAWLFFDPYIGYNRGQHQSVRSQGIGYGARLGLKVEALYVAGDVTLSEMQQGSIASVQYMDTAAIIGGDLKNFRVWFGQILSTNFQYTSGISQVAYKGTGTKFGVGALVTNKLFLNLEMKTYDYSEVKNSEVVTPVTDVGTFGFLSVSWAF